MYFVVVMPMLLVVVIVFVATVVVCSCMEEWQLSLNKNQINHLTAW